MTKQELANRLKVASYHVDDYAWEVSSDAVLQLVNEIEQSHKHSVMQVPQFEELLQGARWAYEKLSSGTTVASEGQGEANTCADCGKTKDEDGTCYSCEYGAMFGH